MTLATSSTVTIVEHHFGVPDGGDMQSLGVAISWAKDKAAELGIDTSFDDWARITTDEEGMAIVVTERK